MHYIVIFLLNGVLFPVEYLGDQLRYLKITQEFRENLNCKPLLIGCEGMQFGLIPYSGKRTANLTAKIGNNLDLAVTTTDSSSDSYDKYLKYIECAYERKKPIILMGFSQGADFARILAKKACEKNK